MADKAEKDLDLASDCEWVRALDANGKSIRIPKADLLSAMFQHRGSAVDADKTLLSGIYDGVNVNNTPIQDYCTMVVFTNGIYVHQFYFPLNSSSIFYRFTLNRGNSWNPWMEISFI